MPPFDADRPALPAWQGAPSAENSTQLAMIALTPFDPPFDPYIAPAPVVTRAPRPWWQPTLIVALLLLLLGMGLGLMLT